MNTRLFTHVGLAALGLMGMLTTGCEKTSQEEVSPITYKSNAYYAGYRIFNGVDNCARKGGNCTNDVIVIGHTNRRAALNDIFLNMTGNPAAVQEFFNGSTWSEYFPSLEDENAGPFLERLRSGECDIKRVSLDDKEFYYAGAGELTPDKNEMVMPVIYEK